MTKLTINGFVLWCLVAMAATAWATDDDRDRSGGDSPSVTEEATLSALDEQMACNAFEGGRFDYIEADAAKFGGVREYYRLLQNTTCTRARLPLFYSFIYSNTQSSYTSTLYSHLEQVEPDVLRRMLNHPRPGRRQQTVLDLLDLHIGYVEREPEDQYRWGRELRARFVELGAKNYADLTEEEIESYQ